MNSVEFVKNRIKSIESDISIYTKRVINTSDPHKKSRSEYRLKKAKEALYFNNELLDKWGYKCNQNH